MQFCFVYTVSNYTLFNDFHLLYFLLSVVIEFDIIIIS